MSKLDLINGYVYYLLVPDANRSVGIPLIRCAELQLTYLLLLERSAETVLPNSSLTSYLKDNVSSSAALRAAVVNWYKYLLETDENIIVRKPPYISTS